MNERGMLVRSRSRTDGRTSVDVHLQAFMLDDGGELRVPPDEIGTTAGRAVTVSAAHRRRVIALWCPRVEEDFDFW